MVAALVLEVPKACALAAQGAWEVTRLAVGPAAPKCTASLLLGAAWRCASACGSRRLVSYTRQDEEGACYRAAGWVAVATVAPQSWEDSHAAAGKTLTMPGIREPSTEVVARVRWEIGPDAATTRVRRGPDGSWAAASGAG